MGLFFSSFLLFLYVLNCSQGAWIDPHTPTEAHKAVSFGDGSDFHLVMSDEFNFPGRNFKDGVDPRWTAINHKDPTNGALQFYSNEAINTSDGKMHIWTNASTEHENKPDFTSGMIQSWNKFCFTGGIVEISVKMPGAAHTGGLWPAAWLMGNLARATYMESTNRMWPWSYDICSSDLREAQIVSKCNKVNHFGLHSNQGRGAPEIDIFETMPGTGTLPLTNQKKPYVSTSYQVSPGITKNRPMEASFPSKPDQWYSLIYGENTQLNPYYYGSRLEYDGKLSYQVDSLSANTEIPDTVYGDFHTFRIEWEVDNDPSISWYLDGNFMFKITEASLQARTRAMISREPMYLIINTAIAKTWGFPMSCPTGCNCDCFNCRSDDCKCALPHGMCEMLPASMQIDYVRVYQRMNTTKQSLGCSTTDFPTERYINGHKQLFTDDQAHSDLLMPVRNGGGKCTESKNCGESTCVDGFCKCTKDWTGPNCLAPNGFFEDSQSGIIDNFYVVNFVIPSPLLFGVCVLFVALIFTVSVSAINTHKSKLRFTKLFFPDDNVNF